MKDHALAFKIVAAPELFCEHERGITVTPFRVETGHVIDVNSNHALASASPALVEFHQLSEQQELGLFRTGVAIYIVTDTEQGALRKVALLLLILAVSAVTVESGNVFDTGPSRLRHQTVRQCLCGGAPLRLAGPTNVDEGHGLTLRK